MEAFQLLNNNITEGYKVAYYKDPWAPFNVGNESDDTLY